MYLTIQVFIVTISTNPKTSLLLNDQVVKNML